MTENTKNEIVKSHIYGMSNEDIASVYGVPEDDVKMLLCERREGIEAERKYRQMLEGGKADV